MHQMCRKLSLVIYLDLKLNSITGEDDDQEKDYSDQENYLDEQASQDDVM